jgi:AcrR family transcriptional regulator
MMAPMKVPREGPGAEPVQLAVTARAKGRIYSGLDPSARAQERRDRLILAGIEVFGTTGYLRAKVKDVCLEAGLSERYFYESFGSREHLLSEVYSHLVERLFAATQAAMDSAGGNVVEGAHAGLSAFVRFLLEDRRHARIVLIEVVGVSPSLEAMRFEVLGSFAGIVHQQVLLDKGPVMAPDRTGGPAAEPQGRDFAALTAVALVGAVNHLLVDVLLGVHEADEAMVVEVGFRLFEQARAGLQNRPTA